MQLAPRAKRVVTVGKVRLLQHRATKEHFSPKKGEQRVPLANPGVSRMKLDKKRVAFVLSATHVSILHSLRFLAAKEVTSPIQARRIALNVLLVLTKTRGAVHLARPVALIGTGSWTVNELMKPQDLKVHVMGFATP